jgi:hypothetical protein
MLRQSRAWFLRIRGSFSRARFDREMLAELQAHIEMEIRANISAGMSPAAAKRKALITCGGVQQTLEECRDCHSNRRLDRFCDSCVSVLQEWVVSRRTALWTRKAVPSILFRLSQNDHSAAIEACDEESIEQLDRQNRRNDDLVRADRLT